MNVISMMGGADVIDAYLGDDIIVAADMANVRASTINGGSGTDTLKILDSAINLTGLVPAKLQSIENLKVGYDGIETAPDAAIVTINGNTFKPNDYGLKSISANDTKTLDRKGVEIFDEIVSTTQNLNLTGVALHNFERVSVSQLVAATPAGVLLPTDVSKITIGADTLTSLKEVVGIVEDFAIISGDPAVKEAVTVLELVGKDGDVFDLSAPKLINIATLNAPVTVAGGTTEIKTTLVMGQKQLDDLAFNGDFSKATLQLKGQGIDMTGVDMGGVTAPFSQIVFGANDTKALLLSDTIINVLKGDPNADPAIAATTIVGSEFEEDSLSVRVSPATAAAAAAEVVADAGEAAAAAAAAVAAHMAAAATAAAFDAALAAQAALVEADAALAAAKDALNTAEADVLFANPNATADDIAADPAVVKAQDAVDKADEVQVAADKAATTASEDLDAAAAAADAAATATPDPKGIVHANEALAAAEKALAAAGYDLDTAITTADGDLTDQTVVDAQQIVDDAQDDVDEAVAVAAATAADATSPEAVQALTAVSDAAAAAVAALTAVSDAADPDAVAALTAVSDAPAPDPDALAAAAALALAEAVGAAAKVVVDAAEAAAAIGKVNVDLTGIVTTSIESMDFEGANSITLDNNVLHGVDGLNTEKDDVHNISGDSEMGTAIFNGNALVDADAKGVEDGTVSTVVALDLGGVKLNAIKTLGENDDDTEQNCFLIDTGTQLGSVDTLFGKVILDEAGTYDLSGIKTVGTSVNTSGTVEGSAGDDIVMGSATAAMTFIMHAGNDTVNAGAGNDRMDGGEGADTLNGGKGVDFIDGGVGNDKLDGGEGADTLNGGAGIDSMTGGKGNDSFNFVTGDSGMTKETVDCINDLVYTVNAAKGDQDSISFDFMTDSTIVANGLSGEFAAANVGDKFADEATLADSALAAMSSLYASAIKADTVQVGDATAGDAGDYLAVFFQCGNDQYMAVDAYVSGAANVDFVVKLAGVTDAAADIMADNIENILTVNYAQAAIA
jgi:hypothetical protein